MNKMVKALTHLRDHLVEGKPIPPDAGEDLGAVRWEANLETIMRGGSSNHALIRHTLGMLRNDHHSLNFLGDRVSWELENGLCVNEQMSPSYGVFHLGCWLIVAVKAPTSWLRDHARTWVERYLAITACCSVIDNGVLRVLTPGDRSDSGGLHNEEAVMVAKLLGLRGPESWGNVRSTLMLEAVRALDLDGVIRPAVLNSARTVINFKDDVLFTGPLREARLMTPLHFRVYGPDSWAAWIERGRHPQDPPWLATVVEGARVRTLDISNTKPAEGGWKADLDKVGYMLIGAWWQQGRDSGLSRKIRLPDPDPLRSLTIGTATDPPAPPEEPSDTGWPPKPLGPMDPDSYLAKLAAHAQALADGEPGPHLAEARKNLEAWSLRNN